MRKLASVQKIKNIEPITGADKLEKATVLGWQLVVKKDEFKPNDLCIYCEIDSLFPETPDFEFLKPRGMRVKTIRLRGQVSQGICFPLSLLGKYNVPSEAIVEGLDVTDTLGIQKYEPPIPANLSGNIKGNFPSYLPKTDETRVQILQHVLDKYKGTLAYITEKLDGSSVTYYWNNGVFGVCSRNYELHESEENTLWKVARALDLENKLKSIGSNCAVQGEIIGEGVQSNKYRLRGQSVRFFDFFEIDGFHYAGYHEFIKKMAELNLETVPVLSDKYQIENDIEKLVSLSVKKSQLQPETWCEGLVIRPHDEIIDHAVSNGHLHNDRVSFKVINPEFLIKYGE